MAEKPLVTYSHAKSAVEILINFPENTEKVDDSIFNALSVIKRNLRDIKLN
jgi:hypothetical protein